MVMSSSQIQFEGLNPRLIGGIVTASLPVGYVIKKHMDWEETEQAKKRMLTHHLIFWGSFSLGLWVAHRTFFARVSNIQKGLRYLAGGLVGAQGFTSGEWLGKYFFPYQAKPATGPQRDRYIPTYLRQMNYQG